MDSTKIRPRLLARLASASLLALVFTNTARAERLESPLELMYAPGTMIVAGKLVDINPAGRIVLERKDVLGGEDRPPDQIDVRVPKDALGTVKTGERYVVAYSMYQRTSHKAIGLSPRQLRRLVSERPEIRNALHLGDADRLARDFHLCMGVGSFGAF